MASRVDKYEELARVFHALGNETRLSIMTLLADGEVNVGAICKKLQLLPATTSHHLGLLRRGGLVVEGG